LRSFVRTAPWNIGAALITSVSHVYLNLLITMRGVMLLLTRVTGSQGGATSAAFFRWLRYEQFSVPTCRSGQALRLGDVASFLLPVGSSVGRLGASEMYGEQYPAPNRVSVLESSSVFLADLIPSQCDAVMGSLSLSSLSFPLSPLTDFLTTELFLSLQNI
jgi:hypothetical protein